jgi:pimeloyl-ACP methyl ester carboxylesterase
VPTSSYRVALILVCALLVAPLLAQRDAASKVPPLTVEQQGSFFVGGRDVHSDTLSSTGTRAPSGTITVDQVYVKYQIPAGAKGHPVTFIHGCCLTGKTWETTPDGRMGWDEYFVRKGHGVYVIDQASRGRSAANASAINRTKVGKAPVDQLPPVYAVSHEEAWTIFRFGPEYPKTFAGLQFPIDAQSEFWKQMVPDWIETLPTPNPTVPALSELARRLQGTILISHSQSGIYPFQTAVLSTSGIAGIISIEPGACPAATEPMAPYTRMPVLVLFGDYVDLSARWAPRLKACRDFAQAVNKSGGKAEVVLLPDVGFHGNSHMLMQDRNSLAVADWLLAWIDRNATDDAR